MFKFKLDSLDGLSDEHKALYEKKGDKFVLKVEGLEDGDVAGLKTKNETLLADIAKLKDKVKENDEAREDRRRSRAPRRRRCRRKEGRHRGAAQECR
jgi:hypothetical protein